MRGTPPAVREWMTRVPMDAEQCETVGEAMRLMQAYGIRHMPVMCGMSLQGLVSQRDILKARCEYGDKL